MDRHVLVAFALLAAATDAAAGRIYGALQFNGHALEEGREIYLVCPPQADHELIRQSGPRGAVGRYGRYNVEAPGEGYCTLAVRLDDGSLATTRIISFTNPTRYDFVIRRQGDQALLERNN